jgi:hypothetical protein
LKTGVLVWCVSCYSKIRTPIADAAGRGINRISDGTKSTTSNRAWQLVTCRHAIYHVEPESYSAFIPPEGCIAPDKYFDFRREHAEQINDSLPLPQG